MAEEQPHVEIVKEESLKPMETIQISSSRINDGSTLKKEEIYLPSYRKDFSNTAIPDKFKSKENNRTITRRNKN